MLNRGFGFSSGILISINTSSRSGTSVLVIKYTKLKCTSTRHSSTAASSNISTTRTSTRVLVCEDEFLNYWLTPNAPQRHLITNRKTINKSQQFWYNWSPLRRADVEIIFEKLEEAEKPKQFSPKQWRFGGTHNTVRAYELYHRFETSHTPNRRETSRIVHILQYD